MAAKQLKKTGIFYGKVVHKAIQLDDRTTFLDWMGENMDGSRFVLFVRKDSEYQTKDQYRYLYSAIYQPLAEHLGYTVREIDGVMKRHFILENKLDFPEGWALSKAMDLDRELLAKYIDFCATRAAYEGLVVLPPNPQWKQGEI